MLKFIRESLKTFGKIIAYNLLDSGLGSVASGVVESWQLYYQKHRKKMQKIVPVYFVG